MDHVPLILGGHSFIKQLGNEPKPTEAEQIEIVTECLDNGITWFDTTYLPERVALGRCLKTIDRRDEATIIAWNFFKPFGDDEPHGKAEPFRKHHIQQMLDELQTDYIDCLVVHSVNDPHKDRIQEKVAMHWLESGYVKRLGTWHPEPDDTTLYRDSDFYSFMVRPCNITTPDATAAFTMGKELGWETIACSPFVRGYVLDEIVQIAMEKQIGGYKEKNLRRRIADLMLRFSLYQENVDRLIVSMRKSVWIHTNIEIIGKGPLAPEELQLLTDLTTARLEE